MIQRLKNRINSFKKYILGVLTLTMYLFIFLPFAGGMVYKYKKKHFAIVLLISILAYFLDKYIRYE